MCTDFKNTAAFFETRKDLSAICGLCPHRCVIAPGGWGDCKTRQNIDGVLKVASHGRLLAAASDPVEKKPLFHYRPGSITFSAASAGCNLRCPFCQNHQISQTSEPWDFLSVDETAPAEIVRAALRLEARSISFTYSEPTLMFELARDTAKLALPSGLDLIFVTNGQASEQAAAALSRFIRAANVDIKCFSKAKYRDVLGGFLKSTLRTVEMWAAAGVWVEITTLLIPGFNDSEKEIRDIARFIAGTDRFIPWHISRFHPDYRWRDLPVTPADKIRIARDIGLSEGLRFVYTGNMPGGAAEETTRCPACNAAVVERRGFSVHRTRFRDGRCAECGASVPGVFS